MKDLSSVEEDLLPLPKYWERVQSLSASTDHYSHGEVKKFFYRNVSTGLESHEHPYIHQALEVARNLILPNDWIIKEAVDEDGVTDYYYYNAEMGASLWDPPLLRQCLADVLGSDGHSTAAVWILTEDTENHAAANFNHYNSRADDYHEEELFGHDKVSSAYSRFKNFQDEQENQDHEDRDDRLDVEDLSDDNNDFGYHDDLLDDDINYNVHDNGINRGFDKNKENCNSLAIDDFNISSGNNKSNDNINHKNVESDELSDAFDQQSVRSENVSIHSADMSSKYRNTNDEDEFVKTWDSFRQSRIRLPDPNEKLVNVNSMSRPPKNVAGIRMLKVDSRNANTRVHELLARLRTGLCEKHGLQCRVIDPFLYEEYNSGDGHISEPDRGDSNNNPCYQEKDLMWLAANIISKLRKHPERLISMMSKVFKPGDGGMAYASFIILHRIMHPFSADASTTTSVILHALSFQLQELASISEMFSDLDPKYIMTRSIFMKDPTISLSWDPLSQPMPMVPNVEHETMFSCLLRIYSIRRDVSSFFRTVWRPSLPAILKTIHDRRIDRKQFFINLTVCACKIIECTFDDMAIAMFPATATAICRTLYDIGGMEPLNHYLLNFLVMPNLIKIVTGDHNSIENELSYRKDQLNDMLNSYFDCNLWWPEDGFHAPSVAKNLAASQSSSKTLAGSSPVPPVVVSPLYWLLWRIYTGACFLDIATIDNLSSPGFFAGGPQFDFSGYPDPKLRVLLARMKRKIESGCRNILALKLDSFGSKFLGDPKVKGFEDMKTQSALIGVGNLLESRTSAILARPDDLMSLLVASRRELAYLFHCAGVDIELQKKTHKSTLYRSIAEYLLANEYLPESSDFEFLVVPFNYTENLDLLESDEKLCLLKYDQLTKGLVLASRYEQSLLDLIRVVESNSIVTLDDLLTDDIRMIAPEFECNLPMLSGGVEGKKEMYKQHTTASLPKQRRECNLGLKPHDVLLEVEKVQDLFITHVPMMEEHSTRSIFENIHKGLRFGSTSENACAGTQMFSPHRPKTKSAALPRFDKPLSHRELNHNNRLVTKVDIDPNTHRFLAQTDAENSRIDLIRKREDTYRLRDDLERYKDGLRSYSPLSSSSSSSASSHGNIPRANRSGRLQDNNNKRNNGGRGDFSSASSTATSALDSSSPLTPMSSNDYPLHGGTPVGRDSLVSPSNKKQGVPGRKERTFKHPDVSHLKNEVLARAQSPTETALHRVVSTDLWYNHDKYVLELRPSPVKLSNSAQKKSPPRALLSHKSAGEMIDPNLLTDEQIEHVMHFIKSCCYDESTEEVTLTEFEQSFRKHKYWLLNSGLENHCRSLMEKLENLLSQSKLTIDTWFEYSDTRGGIGGDGSVSHLELIESISRLCSRLGLPDWSKQDVLHMLTYMNPNGDSDLSRKEVHLAFKKYHSPPEAQSKITQATPLFSKLEELMQRQRIRVRDLFKRIDADGSDTISFEKLKVFLRKMFGTAPKFLTQYQLPEPPPPKLRVQTYSVEEGGASVIDEPENNSNTATSEVVTMVAIPEMNNRDSNEYKTEDKDSVYSVSNSSSKSSKYAPSMSSSSRNQKKSMEEKPSSLHSEELANYVDEEAMYKCVFEKGNIIREGHWLQTPLVMQIKKDDIVMSVGYGYVKANGYSTRRLKVKLKDGRFGWCSATLASEGQSVVMERYKTTTPHIDEALKARSSSPAKPHVWQPDELIKKISTDGFVVTKYNIGGGSAQKKVYFNAPSEDLVWIDASGRRKKSVFSSTSESKIALKTIEEIRRGTQTDTFKPYLSSIDPARACSVVTAERTLDVVLESAHERNLFVRALTAVTDKIDHHVSIL